MPGAEVQKSACLADLTTAGTVTSGHTNLVRLSRPQRLDDELQQRLVPDSQFVIRLPEKWNGGLVVSGAPGVRTQYANDAIIGD